MKFRKKPVVIDAIKFVGGKRGFDGDIPMWLAEALVADTVRSAMFALHIKTLEGTMTAKEGDWIIRGVKGELYPCKPDIFEATYEAVQ